MWQVLGKGPIRTDITIELYIATVKNASKINIEE